MNNWHYYWLTTIKNIGYKKTKYLLDAFDTPVDVYGKDYGDYEKLGYLSKKDIEAIVESKDKNRIITEMEAMKRESIKIISIDSNEYPELLRQIDNPPYVLYKKGEGDLKKPCIAIVGSRKCSEYGYTMAYEIAKGLSKAGVMVVSGLALGIDAAAHKGALEDGATVAVLGNGSDICYPPSNSQLQKQIELMGCTLSEYPLGTNPNPGFFPARNRIISGLCRGVLIVEAAERSGSLITANLALEQGRDVFAVPGNVWSKMSIGSNKIIQSGAKLVMNSDDILEEIEQYLPLKAIKSDKISTNPHLNGLAQDEIMVYDYLSQEPLYIDEVNNEVKIPIAVLQHIITSLELKGLSENGIMEGYYGR